MGKKNDEFSFLVKLMSKLICLINVVVIDNIFSFKSSNTIIMNYGFEFDSIAAIQDIGISIASSSPFLPSPFTSPHILELLQVQLSLS